VSELLLRKFPGYIFAKDSKRVFRYVSPSLVHDLGLHGPEDMLGKCDRDFFPKDEVEGFKEADERVISGKESEVFRKEKVTTKGERRTSTRSSFRSRVAFTVWGTAARGSWDSPQEPRRSSRIWNTSASFGMRSCRTSRMWSSSRTAKAAYLEVNRAFERLFGGVPPRDRSYASSDKEVLNRLEPRWLKEIFGRGQICSAGA